MPFLHKTDLTGCQAGGGTLFIDFPVSKTTRQVIIQCLEITLSQVLSYSNSKWTKTNTWVRLALTFPLEFMGGHSCEDVGLLGGEKEGDKQNIGLERQLGT